VKTRSRGEFRISVNPARKGRCALEVFSGFRRIRRVFAGDLDIGPNALRWDQKDDDGRFVRAGSYKVVFTDADGKKTSTRCVIVR
jgi:hypothetical protein